MNWGQGKVKQKNYGVTDIFLSKLGINRARIKSETKLAGELHLSKGYV